MNDIKTFWGDMDWDGDGDGKTVVSRSSVMILLCRESSFS